MNSMQYSMLRDTAGLAAHATHLGSDGDLPTGPSSPVATFGGEAFAGATAAATGSSSAMSWARIAAYGLAAAASSSDGFPDDPVGLVRSGVAAGLSGRERPPARHNIVRSASASV